jgi:hypothetical protein
MSDTTTIQTTETPAVPKARKIRVPAIDITQVTIPQGVEIITMKSGIAIRKGSRKFFLKKRVLEMNREYSVNTLPALPESVKVTVFTEEEIKRRHLGATKTCISNLDEVLLSKILRTTLNK